MPGLVHVNRTMVAIFANIKCESWLSDRAFHFKGAFFVRLVWVAGYGQTRTRPFSALGLTHQGRVLVRRLHRRLSPQYERQSKEAPSKRRSIHAPNLTDGLSTAEERGLNQFRSAGLVLERQTALNSAGSVTLCDVGARPTHKAFFSRAEPNG